MSVWAGFCPWAAAVLVCHEPVPVRDAYFAASLATTTFSYLKAPQKTHGKCLVLDRGIFRRQDNNFLGTLSIGAQLAKRTV